MIYENPLAEILSVHNFKVKSSLAEMLCYTFYGKIECDRKINVKLFNRFHKYKPLYIFSYGGVLNYTPEKQPVKLTGIEVVVPSGEEEEFLENNSNFIFYGGPNCGLQWLDEEDGVNVYGTCKVTF
jgi:hypothetical protein